MAGLFLLLGVGAAVQAAAPTVAGIGLGASPPLVLQVLGQPDQRQQSLGMRFWDYGRTGMTVVWREETGGVHGIVLRKREAGELGGIRVGDGADAVRAVWGTPARVRHEGRFLDFVGHGWTLSVEVMQGRVIEITLMAAS